MKVLGYVDGTNFMVLDNESLTEIYRIITDFEKATGSQLNKIKTKIFGLGNWTDRDHWPLPWLQTVKDLFNSLGAYHCNQYDNSICKNWNVILNSIRQHSIILLSRRLSLHQRATYANSCMMSKIWYVSHIYPLTDPYVKEINKTIFQYIWGGRYEPVRRSTVYRSKKNGGLGIANIMFKSKTIMVNTFLKCYLDEGYNSSFLYYYCYIRLNNIIPSDYSIHNTSPFTTPYYEIALNVINNSLHLPNFPVISNEKLYENMLGRDLSLSETLYPTFHWGKIWGNFHNILINTYDREIIYKHLHLCLATNQRLFAMNLVSSNQCNRCPSENEQTPVHLFYECQYVNGIFMWLLKVLFYICIF